MGKFDHLFEGKKPAAAPVAQRQTEAPLTAPKPPMAATEEQPGPWPVPAVEFVNGKAAYYAFSAPKYQPREWFFMMPRFQSKMHCPEMLRYDLLMRIMYSPAGDMFGLIYSDMVYLIKGRGLRKAVTFIAERYLEFLQEFDPTLHRALESDDPIITSMEAFARRDPAVPDWLKPGGKGGGG